MSTRANAVLRYDDDPELWFYRHSDGYPEAPHGALVTLERLLEWVKAGRVRRDPMQAGGWLVLLGMIEAAGSGPLLDTPLRDLAPRAGSSGWQIGTWEPTAGMHGDIEYLYVVDLQAGTISVEVPKEISS